MSAITISEGARKAIAGLLPYNLTQIKKIAGPIAITSIDATVPTAVVITAGSGALSNVMPGDILNIAYGEAENVGVHIIAAVNSGVNTVTIPEGVNQGAIGSITVYRCDINQINQVYNDAIAQANSYTGHSFNAVKPGTIQFKSGNGEPALVLERKVLNEITKVEALASGQEEELSYNVPSYEADLEAGILYATAGIRQWPKGKENFRITYSYGFDTPPDDVISALSKMVAADMLANEAGIDGGGGSLSVVSWSRTFPNGGKYAERRVALYQGAANSLNRYKVRGL